jgi:integrase
MAHNTTVTLSSNGKYWQAFYYDSMGKRRAKSLGPKSKLSKRQAKVLSDRMAADMQLNPGRRCAGKAPRLKEYVQRYLTSRTDISDGTYKLHDMTCRYLLAFFKSDLYIDRVTRALAADWRGSLARGDLESAKKTHQRKITSEATVCQNVRAAKVIFSHAVRDDLIMFNPFDRLNGGAPEPDKDWHYVAWGDFERLLEACRNVGWHAFLGLQRIAGLRRGEALELRWASVDWDDRRLTVIARKTRKRRIIPIEPPLFRLLLDSFGQARPGEEQVVPRKLVSRNNLEVRLKSIIRRAGLRPWAKPYQVLRRNRETDWAQVFPQYVVSAWMGHNMSVSEKHYLQVPEELYRTAAQLKPGRTATKSATKLPRVNAMLS